jgi:hypothetical protein
MPENAVYLLVVEGFADWEPAHAVAELRTASGLGDVEFARELFEELDVLSADDRALWGQIFRSARLPGGSA